MAATKGAGGQSRWAHGCGLPGKRRVLLRER